MVDTLPIFQMVLGQDSNGQTGWQFSDEISDDDGFQSFSYVIPWPANGSAVLLMAVDQDGAEGLFELPFDGQYFANRDLGVRFTLSDPGSPRDFRGLPFVQGLPYVGAMASPATDGLLVPLFPLDLIQMDELYRQRRLSFVGMTRSFPQSLTLRERLNRVDTEGERISRMTRGLFGPQVIQALITLPPSQLAELQERLHKGQIALTPEQLDQLAAELARLQTR